MRGGRGPDFIGIGGQRCGTSWIYACLYEHPQVCAPIKEVHFFSRERNWSRGYAWYESLFADCPPHAKVGEFSTSYLYDQKAPLRIYQRYPRVRLIVSLRHPVERAYSNYLNDLMDGVLPADTPFEKALMDHPEYLERGRYWRYLQTYLAYFPPSHLLVLIYEDALRDPKGFIQGIYRFIGVDHTFVPTMLYARVNVGRIPWSPALERHVNAVAERLIRTGSVGRRAWWLLKKLGFGRMVRTMNTKAMGPVGQRVEPRLKAALLKEFEEEIRALEAYLGRSLDVWRR